MDLPELKEQLETIMKEAGRKKKIAKIKTLEVNSAVEEGVHFLGTVLRVNLKAIMGDGSQNGVSVVVKKIDPPMRQYLSEMSALSTEKKMYTQVLPNMAKLLQTSKYYMEPLWPECFSVENYDTFILEDLCTLGFNTLKKNKFFDLDVSLFVLQALARFHAVSVVAKDKYLLDPNDFSNYWFGKNNPTMLKIYKKGISNLAHVIKFKWGSEWQELGNDLEVLSETIQGRVKRVVDENKSVLNVLNHVDPRAANILVRYCSLSGKLNGVRFLDFQTAYYGSFAIDLQFFLHVSVQPDVREEHYNTLLSVYHESLLKTFNLLNYEPEIVPSLEDIKMEMENYLFIGVTVAIHMLYISILEKEDFLEMETFLSSKDSHNSKTYNSPLYTSTIKKLLGPHINSGLLKMYL